MGFVPLIILTRAASLLGGALAWLSDLWSGNDRA